MRRKLSLKFKVGSIVATMAVGAGVISWIGMSRLSLLQGALTETVEVQGKRVQSIAHIQKAFASIILAEKNYLLDEDQKIRDEREKGIANQDKAIREEIESLIANAPADQKDDLTNLKKSYSDFLPVSESARKLAREGKLKEAIQISQTKGKDARLEVEMNAEAVSDKNQDAMAKAEAQGQVTYTRARLNIFLATFLSLGLGLFQAVWTMRAIGKSISQAISALTENSSQLGATAQNVASTSTQISQAATEQSSVVQETASSIEEMSSMVSKNSESARKASEVSAESQKSAVHGKEVVEKMMHSIQEIDASNSNIMDQIGQGNQQLTEIVRVISDIATKTQVINDIVFQTKLLSFNASVEAARAGEHGKGFAVVAEEVGNLAQMSGNAAREITDMLDNSIHKVENIVQETKSKVESLVGDNKAKVSEGVQIAKECQSVLDEIVGSISGLTNMAASISSASQEQASGVREITQAMSQLDQVTQQNAAASEQAANAASLLSKQADDLNHVISSLNEAIYGGDSKAQTFTPSHRNETKVSSGPKKTVAEAPAVKAEPALVHSEAKAKEVAKSAKPMPKKEAKKAVKAAEKTGTKTAGAEVIPLPVKEKAATSQPVENEIRLKTAGVGSLASLPSPDDERFKDI